MVEHLPTSEPDGAAAPSDAQEYDNCFRQEVDDTGGLMPPAAVCVKQPTPEESIVLVRGIPCSEKEAEVAAPPPQGDQPPPPYRPKLELQQAQSETLETINYSECPTSNHEPITYRSDRLPL